MDKVILITTILLVGHVAFAQSAILTAAHSDVSMAYGVGGIFLEGAMPAGPIAQALASSTITSTQEEDDQVLTIYPNPAHDVLHVEGFPLTDRNTIRISDAQGRVVQEATTHDDRLDIATLMPGLYFLRVNAAYITRFIKL